VIILAIDTTSENGSLALRKSGELLEETSIHAPDGFAQVIFGRIEELLVRHGMTLPEIDIFAGAGGPGSFTGVRVGLTVAKGLAETLGRPVASVSNLRALAAFGNSGRRAAILDARRGDIFGAVYDDQLEAVSEERVMKLPEWLETFDGEPQEFISLENTTFREMVSATRFSGVPWRFVPPALASAIAFCAEADEKRGRLLDPVQVDANYVRSSDAELHWTEKR
jgi:tRNA threonylcarbamoyladenosine biosynthesis protein TsaB